MFCSKKTNEKIKRLTREVYLNLRSGSRNYTIVLLYLLLFFKNHFQEESGIFYSLSEVKATCFATLNWPTRQDTKKFELETSFEMIYQEKKKKKKNSRDFQLSI